MTGAVLDKRLYYDAIDYKPHKGQRQLHYTPARFKVVRCGRRWGKTLFGARECEPNTYVPCPITGEPQLGWIVGPQYSDAEKEFGLAYDSLRKQGVEKESIRFINGENGAMHIKTTWGFELLGKSAKHPETLVGEGLNFVLMVEAGRHKRKTWGQYIRPALSDRRGWAAFTGVPEGKSQNSLLYALYQRGQGTNPTWRSWQYPSWTNTIVFPGGRNDPEILAAEEDLTTDEFDRQYGAEFSDKVGIVMQEWDDETHLANVPYVMGWPVYMAVDYGFTNPFVVLFIQIDPIGQVRVIRERRFQGLDTDEVCADLLETESGLVAATQLIYPDPAEPDDTRTMERKLRKGAIRNTGGALKTRLAYIRRALKIKNIDYPVNHPDRKAGLIVDRSCTQLAWEMREGYRWPEHRSEVHSDSENPIDKDNHGPEALGRFFKGRSFDNADEGSFVSTARMG